MFLISGWVSVESCLINNKLAIRPLDEHKVVFGKMPTWRVIAEGILLCAVSELSSGPGDTSTNSSEEAGVSETMGTQ